MQPNRANFMAKKEHNSTSWNAGLHLLAQHRSQGILLAVDVGLSEQLLVGVGVTLPVPVWDAVLVLVSADRKQWCREWT